MIFKELWNRLISALTDKPVKLNPVESESDLHQRLKVLLEEKKSEIDVRFMVCLENGQTVSWRSDNQETANNWFQLFTEFTNNDEGTLVVQYQDLDHDYCYSSFPYDSISYLDYRSSVWPITEQITQKKNEKEEPAA